MGGDKGGPWWGAGATMVDVRGRGAVRRGWRGLAVMAWLVVAAFVRAMALALVVAVRLGERRRVRRSVGKVATSWALAFVDAVR